MKSVENKVDASSEYYVFSPSKTAQEIFLYPLQCGNFIYEPGYVLSRSSFDSFLLMYIRKGSVMVYLDGEMQLAHENSFILIDCYEPHSYSSKDGYECLWLHFDGVLARRYYELIVSRLDRVFTMDDAFPVLQKMNNIFRIFAENKPYKEPLLSKYILDILTEFMIYDPDVGKADDCAKTVDKAVGYISEHFAESIPVGMVAAIAGVSESHFIRVFKRETGYTPHEYIINLRMASARYLLKSSTLSIKEICFNTGFSCESVFCNAFKKQHQMTPQQYRESTGSKFESGKNTSVRQL